MNDTVATEDLEQRAKPHERKARGCDRDPDCRTSSRPAEICSAPTGRTYDRSRPNRLKRQKSACQGRPFSNRVSLVNSFVAAPGHGSLRGRNNPPQHLVRSTGAAMSTTSRRAMTPLNGHPRSHPYPRPAGNHHHIGDLADEAVMLVLRSGNQPVVKRAFYSAVASERPVGRSRGDCLLRPAERLSRTPDAMQDDGELSGQRHPCFANARSLGDRQRPILQFRRFLDPRHDHDGGLI